MATIRQADITRTDEGLDTEKTTSGQLRREGGPDCEGRCCVSSPPDPDATRTGSTRRNKFVDVGVRHGVECPPNPGRSQVRSPTRTTVATCVSPAKSERRPAKSSTTGARQRGACLFSVSRGAVYGARMSDQINKLSPQRYAPSIWSPDMRSSNADECPSEQPCRRDDTIPASGVRHLSGREMTLTQMCVVPSGGDRGVDVVDERNSSERKSQTELNHDDSAEHWNYGDVQEEDVDDDVSKLRNNSQFFHLHGQRAVNIEHRYPFSSRTGLAMPPGPAHYVDEYGVLTFDDGDDVQGGESHMMSKRSLQSFPNGRELQRDDSRGREAGGAVHVDTSSEYSRETCR